MASDSNRKINEAFGSQRSARSTEPDPLDFDSQRGYHQPDVRRRNTGAHNMGLTDVQLMAMASQADKSLHWDALQQDLLAPTSRWKRKTGGDSTAIYSRKDTKDGTYSVVAVSELPCNVEELLQLFLVTSTAEYVDVMKAMWGKEFLYGELLHDVENLSMPNVSTRTTRSDTKSSAESVTSAAQLSVKYAVFDRLKSMFRRSEEWFYIDLIKRKQDSGGKLSFTKTMFSLHHDDVFAGPASGRSAQTPRGGGVFMAYSFDEEPSSRITRVRMYAESSLSVGKSLGKSMAGSTSQRMAKHRLKQMTQTSSSLLRILRRRRLGFQVMVDTRLSLVAMKISLPKCGRCTRSFLMVKQKICNLCGNIVCDKCSAIHERERTSRRSIRLDSVRVCHRCIERVDASIYKNITRNDLQPAHVVANDPNRVVHSTRSRRSPSAALLTGLLEDTLNTTSNRVRRASVMNVINCLIQQDAGDKSSVVHLTEESSTDEAVQAMRDHMNDQPLPLDQCVLAGAESRQYVISPPEDPTEALPAVIPANEERRLAIVDKLNMRQLAEQPELDIICSLAAKELGCMASMITVVQKDTYHVLAANSNRFASHTLPRHEGFCNQLIMDDKPLMVPHVESDIRFSSLRLAKDYNINFYCGFPLKAEDDTVIGSVCCVDTSSHELTQSQYTTLKRLAETASKVVQRNA